MSEALDCLVSRNLNYRVEYKWVFPVDVGQMKDEGWIELQNRRAVQEPMRVPCLEDLLDAPPQTFEFVYQVKMCRETLYAKVAP